MPLFDSEIYFIAHKNSQFYDYKEVSVKDIVKEPIILENKNFMIHHIFQNLCKKEGVIPNIYFNTSGFSLCYKLCKEEQGNTLSMPFIYSDMNDHELKLIPFKEHPKWNVSLVHRKSPVLSKVVNDYIKYATDWCNNI